MYRNQLESILQSFRITAAQGNSPKPNPFEVDIFLAGGGGYNSAGPNTACMITGTISSTDNHGNVLYVNVHQSGNNTDWYSCGIDIEAITAIRMRKP